MEKDEEEIELLKRLNENLEKMNGLLERRQDDGFSPYNVSDPIWLVDYDKLPTYSVTTTASVKV